MPILEYLGHVSGEEQAGEVSLGLSRFACGVTPKVVELWRSVGFGIRRHLGWCTLVDTIT